MNVRHESKTALITGASSGIGNELARLFAQDGYTLVLVARRENKLLKLKNELEDKYSIYVKTIVKDLANQISPNEIFSETQKEQLHIDTLVNNAGFAVRGNFLNSDLQEELSLVQVNISSVIHLTKLFVKEMIKKGSGKILNVASTAAFQTNHQMVVYNASKAFVLNFSESLSEEMRSKGILVTALCPGPTETNFYEKAGFKKSTLTNSNNFMKADYVAKQGYDALKMGRPLIIPGAQNKLLAFGVKFIPRSLFSKAAKFMQGRIN